MLRYYKNHFILIVFAILLGGCATQAPYLKLDSSLEKDVRTFNGVNYVPLVKLCDVYGLNWKWDLFSKTAVIEKRGKQIVFRGGSDTALVDGVQKRMERPVVVNGGAVFIPAAFVRSNIGAIVGPAYLERVPELGIPKKFAINTIIIDPGHGGKDVGATGRRLRLREKKLTLEISKKLKEILEERSIKVFMTRTDDRTVSLPARVEMANRSNADLFVSIHVNASRTRTLKGFECYYLSDATDDNARALEAAENASLKIDRNSILGHSRQLDATLWDMTLNEERRESAELAKFICGSVRDTIEMKVRGIRSARFYVLKGARMPSVLVEVGYLSNRDEELKFKDPVFLDSMAKSVAGGILNYKKEYERNQGFTNP